MNANKIIIIFIVLVLFNQDLLAQNIESERFNVEYIAFIDGEYTKATLHLSSDFSVFQWFKSEEEYMKEYFDMENMNFNINIYSEEGLFVCKDFNNHEMFSKEVSIINYYYVSDTIPSVNWIIYPEEKIIGGFNSNKAEGFFRGRKYTVWFSPEISVSNGPWKLGGLPGLILEATDEEGKVHFSLKDIYMHSKDQVLLDICHNADDLENIITWREYVTTVSDDIKLFENTLNDRTSSSIIIKIDPLFFIENHELYHNNEN